MPSLPPQLAQIIGVPRPAGGVQLPLYFQCRFCKQFEKDVSKVVSLLISDKDRYFAHIDCVEQNKPIIREPYFVDEQEQKGV